MSARFRRLTDLFVQGTPVALPEGAGYLWVQVANSYEREECVSDAQIARARLILALKDQGGERTKVEGRLAEIGFDAMAEDLAVARAGQKIARFAEDMRADPDWKERMDILLKTDFESASSPATEAETLLLVKINAEILAEFNQRETDEHDFLMRKFKRMTDDEFVEEWVEEWIDRKGTTLAGQEYRLTEVWYATRFCEAQPDEDGALDHGKCDGHRERVFETKTDARAAPQGLYDLVRSALDDLNLEGSDPKGSGNAESSSGSSPTPNEAAEASTVSTPEATPALVPGS